MSTSSGSFKAITAEFPEEAPAISRLREMVTRSQLGKRTLDHLIHDTEPESVESFIRILSRLSESGVLRRAYVVESPGDRAPIEEFERYEDIPPTVEDWTKGGHLLTVTPADITVVYRVAK